MVWDIGSTPISKQQFSQLRNRLLLSYLTVIAIILGAFSTAIYGLVARDRNHQLNLHLRQVAVTSASTLGMIRHEYAELLTEDDYADYLPSQTDATPVPLTLSQLMRIERDKAATKTIPNPFTPENQGVEWFDENQQLIVREGNLFPSAVLPADGVATQGWVQQGNIRSYILPVYGAPSANPDHPLGYVRTSESTVHLNEDLRRLRRGLALGVGIVSGLATLGGVWLTRESLKPVLISVEQLKQFTSDASHELRNPLTAIRASIAVMQTHPERIHPADADKLKAIASASTQMSQLVDDLLLLARIDRQTPDRQTWRQIALDEVLEDLVNLYGDRAEQAEITLKPILAVNLEVVGDATQLQRLFTNLLVNALQYTPPGGCVTVALQQSGFYALVRVQDTGIGIAPNQLPHIFDRFWQADQARSRHQAGSGLGLSIAQAIAQRHGGDITVQSQPDIGSCFFVKLPLARSA